MFRVIDGFDVLGHRRARLVERRDQRQGGSFPRQLCNSASWDRQRGTFTFINAAFDVYLGSLHYKKEIELPVQTWKNKQIRNIYFTLESDYSQN